MKTKKLLPILFLPLFLIIAGCGGGSGENSGDSGGIGTIRLAWDAPTTNADGTPLTDLAGYRIYYGTSSGVYSQNVDAGNATTHTLTGLTKGQTYFFAATAYDTSNNESELSNEISGIAN